MMIELRSLELLTSNFSSYTEPTLSLFAALLSGLKLSKT